MHFPLVARVGMIATFVVSMVAMMPAQPAVANNIAFTQTVFNTDVAYFGIGMMRGNGTGTLVSTVPGASVTKALLYWHGPTNSALLTANANVTFDGIPIVGTNIGLSNDNCWGFANSQAYVADVTALVVGNDGTFNLTNFTKTDADINGASLIEFYNDGNATNNRDIVLFHGNDSNISNTFDADGWNVTLAGINYTSGAASIDLHVSDGQTFTDDALILNGSTLVPTGAIFQGNTVQLGNGSIPPNGALWDVKSFDVTSFLNPGPNTLQLTTGVAAGGDCLSLVVAAVNLPTGTLVQEQTPPTCVLTAVIAGPPKQLQITVQDTGSGLALIVPTTMVNATVSVPVFVPGTTSAVVVTATKTNQALAAQVGLTVTDVAGNVTTCDPVVTTVIRESGKTVNQTFTSLPSAESKVSIYNDATNGVKKVEVWVNGTKFKAQDLSNGQNITIDVASAMRAGNANAIEIKANGDKGSSVTVVIHD